MARARWRKESSQGQDIMRQRYDASSPAGTTLETIRSARDGYLDKQGEKEQD
jgi:hypothetical protein